MRKSLIGLAALAVAAGIGAASVSSAGAAVKPRATTVCSNAPGATRCTNISNLLLNQDNGPAFIQNATTGQARDSKGDGRRLNLRQASNTRTNEDFQIQFLGTLGQLCGVTGVNGLDATSYACLTYPSFYPVYQAEFSPDSNQSGACAGAISATEGFKIRLEPCGSPQTMWVADLAQQITITVPSPVQFLVYFPLEFAASTSASNQLVLTYNPNSTKPANGLFLNELNTSGGQVPDRQMFTLTNTAGFTF